MSKTSIKILLGNDFNYYGLTINEKQIEMWADELSDLTTEEIKNAQEALRKNEKKTRPSLPAEIRSKIYNHPSAEEAWAISPKDESKTVVVTSEIMIALQSVSEHIQRCDFVAARMAFKDSYEKEVENSKSIKQKPKWFPSVGLYSTQEDRDKALSEAIEKNRITTQAALSYSPLMTLPGKTNLQIANRNNLIQLNNAKSEETIELTDEQRDSRLKDIEEMKLKLMKKTEIPDENPV